MTDWYAAVTVLVWTAQISMVQSRTINNLVMQNIN